jgi:hypothetical protein
MTQEQICDAEIAIEMQLAALADKLYSELLLRVPVSSEYAVTEPKYLLQNAENYLQR